MKTKLNIMILNGTNPNDIGGMEVHYKYLIKTLKNLKHNLILATKLEFFLKIEILNSKESSYFSDIKNFIDYIKKYKINVLFFNDGHWIENISSLRLIFPESLFIMRSGGNEFMKASYQNKNIKIQDRQAVWSKIINENINFIIANSIYSWNRMKSIGINQNKIIIIRGGIDLETNKKNILNRAKLRKKFDQLHKTVGKYIFCIVSRHVKFKGIEKVLEAFNLINNKNWFLLILGEGKETVNFWKYCNNNFEKENYLFTGSLEHKEAMNYMALSDCLINNSIELFKKSGNDNYIHTETMGRSIIEAISQNIPIIASNVGGVKEWFNEIKNIGVLIPSDDITKLAENINLFIEQKYKIDIKSDLTKYSWKYIINTLYIQLFGNNRKKYKIELCCDLDDSIIHSFLSIEENTKILKQIISLASEKCEIIFNSARNFENIIKDYNIINDNLNKITIISNCGQKIYKHGKLDIFWDEYCKLQKEIDEKYIQIVENEIIKNNLCYIRKKIVNKLYINFKIIGKKEDINKVVSNLNIKLKGILYFVTNNEKNIKLISNIINKGTALKYLNNYQIDCKYIIGIGNNVLDELFFQYCNKSYIINNQNTNYNNIKIDNKDDMCLFIKQIISEIRNC